jgi:hypothetical protein
MRCCGMVTILIMFGTARAQEQISRVTSASAYVERGKDWATKGAWDRAIADWRTSIVSA